MKILRLFLYFFLPLSITIVWSSCHKATIQVNPHDGVLFLDCRNLVVRNVAFTSDNKIKVSIENLCTTGCSGSVYTGVLMSDRNSRDTLGISPCYFCSVSPKNGAIQDYLLDTKLSKLPNLQNVQYKMVGLCEDMTVKPK